MSPSYGLSPADPPPLRFTLPSALYHPTTAPFVTSRNAGKPPTTRVMPPTFHLSIPTTLTTDPALRHRHHSRPIRYPGVRAARHRRQLSDRRHRGARNPLLRRFRLRDHPVPIDQRGQKRHRREPRSPSQEEEPVADCGPRSGRPRSRHRRPAPPRALDPSHGPVARAPGNICLPLPTPCFAAHDSESASRPQLPPNQYATAWPLPCHFTNRTGETSTEAQDGKLYATSPKQQIARNLATEFQERTGRERVGQAESPVWFHTVSRHRAVRRSSLDHQWLLERHFEGRNSESGRTALDAFRDSAGPGRRCRSNRHQAGAQARRPEESSDRDLLRSDQRDLVPLSQDLRLEDRQRALARSRRHGPTADELRASRRQQRRCDR